MKNIMQKEILAKSYNLRTNQQEQTLVEHIKDLFEVLESILELNLYSDKDVEILKICCALHDLGKINSIMQQKMEINNKISYSCSEEERKKLESDKKSLKKIARHNIFSGAFLKDILEKMNLSEEDKLYIYKSIMLHHGNYEDYMRLSTSKVQKEIYDYIEKGILEKEDFNLEDIEDYIKEILDVDFKFNEDVLDYDYIDKLSESMFIDSDYNNGQIDDSVLNYRKFKYILYKGMLNLIDHSASSRQKGIKFYNDFTDEEIDNMILNEIYKSQGNLEKNNIEFNTIQKRLRELSGRNVLTVAFTGSGKTAADYRKTFKRKFFLVPNKISAESFYRKNIFQNKNDLDNYIKYNKALMDERDKLEIQFKKDYMKYATQLYERDELKSKEQQRKINMLILIFSIIILLLILISRMKVIKLLKKSNFIDGMTNLYNRKYEAYCLRFCN